MKAPIIDKSGPIRRFADDGIQEVISRALATLPPEKTGAVVLYANGSETRLAVMGRKRLQRERGGELRWTVVTDRPHSGGPLDIEAAVAFDWP